MSDPPLNLDPKLAELRERFRERLPIYRDRLHQAGQRLAAGGGNDALSVLRQVAHELIGVSGMLDFSGISRAAAAVENGADAAIAGGAATATLHDLVQRLEREIELEL
jgi:hypothetical protein